MKLLALLLGLSLPASARAAYFDGGVDQTFGSASYAGTSGYAEIGADDGFYLRPGVKLYKNNFSSGTYTAAYGRVGYNAPLFSIGAEGGATPKMHGYRNATAEGDVTFTLSPSGNRGRRLAGPGATGSPGRSGDGLTRVDVGGAVRHTAHREDMAAGQLKLGQTDVSGFVGGAFFGLRLSGQVTKSAYDKAVPSGFFPQPNLELVGVRNLTTGLADLSTNLAMEGTPFAFAVPMPLSPFISYTYTKFKLNQPSSRAVQVGFKLNLQMLDVRAAYQYYDSGGLFPKAHFVSLGASLNF